MVSTYNMNIRGCTYSFTSSLVYHQIICNLYFIAEENRTAEISNVTYIPVTHKTLPF